MSAGYQPGLPAVQPRAAVAAAGVAVLTVATGWPATALVAANLVLLAALVGDVLVAPSPGRLGVARSLPGVAGLGSTAPLTWRVSNPTRRSVTVALADDLAPSLRASRRRVRLRVPSRATVRAEAVLHPSRRGRFRPATVTVRITGPLGLAARQGRLHVPGELRVYPAFGSRHDAELRIDRARILEVGLRSARGRGTGTEFESLRDWTEGDELRRIDWSATARAGKPIVRDYRAERNQTVMMLLDCGRLMAGQVDGVPRVEHAMDAVMALTAVATRLGDRAGLVTFDRQVRSVVPPARSHGQLGRVTEAMYEIEPALVESDYGAAFTATLARFRRRSLLIVMSDLAEQALDESLFPALPLVLRSHLLVVGAVTDPTVTGWAAGPAADTGAVYRKAAAVRAGTERRRVAARLRSAGVTVVDAEPGRLAPLLADAYLRFKATGRL